MIGVYHYQNAATLTAIRVVNAPAEGELGISEGENVLYIFQNPAIVEYAFPDILGRQHRIAVDGAWVGTTPKFLGRFRMNWQIAEVSEVTGGSIDAYKDIEFLIYLKINYHKFTRGTGRYLRLMMNYNSSIGFPSETVLDEGSFYDGETVFDVVMTQFPPFKAFNTDAMEATAQFETLEHLDKIPYTLAKNRS